MPCRGKVNYNDPYWVDAVYMTEYKEPFYKGGRTMERVPSWTDRIQYHSLVDKAGQLAPELLDPVNPAVRTCTRTLLWLVYFNLYFPLCSTRCTTTTQLMTFLICLTTRPSLPRLPCKLSPMRYVIVSCLVDADDGTHHLPLHLQSGVDPRLEHLVEAAQMRTGYREVDEGSVAQGEDG